MSCKRLNRLLGAHKFYLAGRPVMRASSEPRFTPGKDSASAPGLVLLAHFIESEKHPHAKRVLDLFRPKWRGFSRQPLPAWPRLALSGGHEPCCVSFTKAPQAGGIKPRITQQALPNADFQTDEKWHVGEWTSRSKKGLRRRAYRRLRGKHFPFRGGALGPPSGH